jgi:hypothetical protein
VSHRERRFLYATTSLDPSLFLTTLAWRCEFCSPTILRLPPSYPPHHCPFTPLVPGYGVDLFEGYLLLFPAADLRMDPALRLVAFAHLHNSTTRLRKLECVFRFYVHGGIFDNPPGFFFYLHVEQFVFVFVFICFLWPGAIAGKYEGW